MICRYDDFIETIKWNGDVNKAREQLLKEIFDYDDNYEGVLKSLSNVFGSIASKINLRVIFKSGFEYNKK